MNLGVSRSDLLPGNEFRFDFVRSSKSEPPLNEPLDNNRSYQYIYVYIWAVNGGIGFKDPFRS